MKYEVYSDIKSGDVTINQNGQPLIRIDGAAALTQREVDELVTICNLASGVDSEERPVCMRKRKKVQKLLFDVSLCGEKLDGDSGSQNASTTGGRPVQNDTTE